MRALRAVALLVLAALLGLGTVPAQATESAARPGETPGAAPAEFAEQAAAQGVDISYERIPGHDGISLSGVTVTPKTPGPHPLLVMPGSWGMPSVEYVGAALRLAGSGDYAVISYAARGFWTSGGGIEVAGPSDVSDARKVIDWGLANLPADPARVGMAGVSYGAGLSLLTAAEDNRVRAVSALSGWADLTESLYRNETLTTQSIEALLALGKITGRPSPMLRKLEADYRAGDIEEALKAAPERSASTKVAELNANRPAVMLANAWQDGIFAPNQYADFYERLEVPKRLMFSPGDHATLELTGLFGLPNEIWADTTRWFDRYLRDEQNGIDKEEPVRLKAVNEQGWQSYPDWEGYPDWAAAQQPEKRYYLGEQELGEQPASGWQRTIQAGKDTIANSGVMILSGALQGYLKLPVGVATPLIDRSRAAVWSGQAFAQDTMVTGSPRLRAAVTPSAPNTTLVAYLYDTGPHGKGSLITHAPMTLRDATPGQPREIDLELNSIAWKVPAGHQLTLVVDTMDARYGSESEQGSTVIFESPNSAPASLRVAQS
ncbi:putative CocE/NonD family hydrolase [Tamaricihabitans halophyticus]|uniref:Putative CocE/NonD family hydrolase n=1 Tax=Tamaricihabitans halophyticus TaxID=1262583 RepID=A0A4R2R3J0_9PSEU|nr:CocE/NonD family hydrolase [Tamaricihabitans halophyticus]TCP57133.1 putative CocE/NonD family hydrolase [Tamaricihabitans halophyticus]